MAQKEPHCFIRHHPHLLPPPHKGEEGAPSQASGFIAATLLILLSACAPQSYVEPGVGFGDYGSYQAQREAQLTGQAAGGFSAPGGVDTPIYDLAGTYTGHGGNPPPPVSAPPTNFPA